MKGGKEERGLNHQYSHEEGHARRFALVFAGGGKGAQYGAQKEN